MRNENEHLRYDQRSKHKRWVNDRQKKPDVVDKSGQWIINLMAQTPAGLSELHLQQPNKLPVKGY